MIAHLKKRLSKMEITEAEVPAEIRQWLGDHITEAERAAIKPDRVLTEAEEAAELAALPSDLRKWFGGRLRPQEGR